MWYLLTTWGGGERYHVNLYHLGCRIVAQGRYSSNRRTHQPPHIVALNPVPDIGPVAQPWRRLSRPKSRSRRSRNGDRWAAIACIAQLGSATAVAGRRQLSRHGDSRRGTATAVTERRQPSPRRQPSRKGYEDHQSATAYSITIGLSRRLALATPVAKWRWVSPYGDGCRHGDGCRQMAMGVAKWR